MAAALGACGGLLAPSATLAAGPTPEPLAALQRYRLSNGLRVVLEPRAGAPSVVACVSYDAGFRNEPAEQAGAAYLLAQLMFRGSENLAPGQHASWLARRGGVPSSDTDADHSHFCNELPAGDLALALWLEAERMQHLRIADAGLEKQRAVASEQFRSELFSTPYAHAEARLQQLVYGGYPVYARGPLAIATELPELGLEELQTFHRTRYGPNTAVLSVAGGFDATEAIGHIQTYFGTAEPVATGSYSPPPFVPEQASPRRARVRDQVPGYALYRAWAIGPSRSDDHYALTLATHVLGSGEASRMHQGLVRKLGWAHSVRAWTGNRRGPDLLAVRVVLSENGPLSEVKTWLNEALLKLGNSGPTTRELGRAKARVRSAFTRRWSGSRNRAAELGIFELYWGNASQARSELARYESVTRGQLRRAIRRYLAPQRMNEVVVEPALSTRLGGEPAPRLQASTGGSKRQGNPAPGGGLPHPR